MTVVFSHARSIFDRPIREELPAAKMTTPNENIRASGMRVNMQPRQ